MSNFANQTWFEVIDCCRCGMQFAMTQDFKERRINDHKTFYCPAGHGQVYNGKTEAQKLKIKLEQKQRELDRQINEKFKIKVQRDSVSRSYNKMRDRVKNGVCPCCNRTFENLARHMNTKHPEFGTHDVLKTMRALFGLSQTDLGREINLPTGYISLYENQKPMPEYAELEIEAWIESNSGDES